MQLAIEHRLKQNELGTVEAYHSRCHIKDDGPPYLDTPKYLAEQTLEEFAQRWFLIYAPQQEVDGNAAMCKAYEGWHALTCRSS
jgi:hypothetical protein